MTYRYLGLPLDRALEMMREDGLDNPILTETRAPRGEPRGTPRVVKVQENRVIYARFPDRVEEPA